MKVIPLLSFKNLEDLGFFGLYKFIIISVNLFQNNRKFILLGPGVDYIFHSQIILAFLEEKKLTGEDVVVTTYGGGALAIANPTKQYAPDRFARDQFSEERPFGLFDGKSYKFGETSQKHIHEALQGDRMLEEQFLPKTICGLGIQLAGRAGIKEKKYTIEELKALEN